MQYVKSVVLNIKELLFKMFLIGALSFISLALLFQVFFVFLELSGRQEWATEISREIMWRVDGSFKNNPNNIWYEAEDHIWVESVENQVKIGTYNKNKHFSFS